MSKTVTFIIATLLLLLTTNAHSHTDAAEAAALAWLEAIDSGEYEQAWEASSAITSTNQLPANLLERPSSHRCCLA